MPSSHPCGVVDRIEIYSKDVVIVRRGHYAHKTAQERPKRKKVMYLSQKSRQRLIFVAMNTDIVMPTLITLTYPGEFPSNGKRVKANLHSFLVFLKRQCGGSLSYLWVLEFQKRGAPHIHMTIDYPLPQQKESLAVFRALIAYEWYKIVDSGDIRHQRAGTRVERVRKKDGARRYMAMYASKKEQKRVPQEYDNCGRFWGHSRDIAPKAKRVLETDELGIRMMLHGWSQYKGDDMFLYQTLFGAAECVNRSLSGIDARHDGAASAACAFQRDSV